MIQQIIAVRARGNRARAGVIAALMLSALSVAKVAVCEEWAGPFPERTIESVIEYFENEAERAGKNAFAWKAAGLAAAAGASAGWLGLVEIPAGISYGTYVLAVGGALGALQESAYRRNYSRISRELSVDAVPAGSGSLWLRQKTADAVREELMNIRDSLDAKSRSGLRAGCVIPVMLSGIALYGLSAGTAQGEDLAGLAIGAALVMAVPSVLRYWSLKIRLERVNGLMDLLYRNQSTMEILNE